MAYNHATWDNANYLASKTGLSPEVAYAWLLNEQQSVNNPTNPLNIRKGGAPGQTGSKGGFATYASPHAGLDAAAWLINNSSHYGGIRTAIKTKDVFKEARAIELSPWAGGHYGGGTNPGNISKALSRLEKVPIPSGLPTGGTTSGSGSSPTGGEGGSGPVSSQPGGATADQRICAWATGSTPGICIPQGHILTQADVDGIMTHLQVNGFFSGDDPMGTAQQVTRAILNQSVGQPWGTSTIATIAQKSNIAANATTSTYNPINDVASGLSGLTSVVGKVAGMAGGMVLIVLGVFLYSKSIRTRQEVTTA